MIYEKRHEFIPGFNQRMHWILSGLISGTVFQLLYDFSKSNYLKETEFEISGWINFWYQGMHHVIRQAAVSYNCISC